MWLLAIINHIRCQVLRRLRAALGPPTPPQRRHCGLRHAGAERSAAGAGGGAAAAGAAPGPRAGGKAGRWGFHWKNGDLMGFNGEFTMVTEHFDSDSFGDPNMGRDG